MLSEKILINKAKKDKTAFLKLYNIYYPKIYAYLLVRTKNKELTEDILQETFIKALRALKSYEYRGKSFGAWLFRVASNEMANQWRKNNKTIGYGEDTILENYADPIASAEEQLLAKENTLIQNERQQKLMSALEKLSEKERELITLKYISRLSYKDIAIIYKTRPATLAVRLHRILGKLKNLILETYE